ncbi:MAG TPA: hypothetical protein VIK91_11565 [Nannocystis sp.]
MSNGTHRVTFEGGAQTVYSIAHRDGLPVAPASATYAVIDTRRPATDPSHVLASGAATVDAVSTTLAAAAGRSTADPRRLDVTSATGIRAGHVYLLQSGGRMELVRVEGVAGTTLRLSAPVTHAFPSGAAFLGCEISCDIPAEVCADSAYLTEHALAVRWAPAGLAPYVEPVFVARASPSSLVTADELLAFDPTLAAHAGEDLTPAAAIQQAHADFSVDLLAAGVEDDRILSGPIGRRAVLHLAAYHLVKHSSEASAMARAERYYARYVELRTSLLQGRDKAKTARLTADHARQAPTAQSVFAVRW